MPGAVSGRSPVAAITASTSMQRWRSSVATNARICFSSPQLRFQQQMNAHLRQPMLRKRLLTSGGINDARILAALSISVTALPARQKSIASSLPIKPPPTINTRRASRSCVSQARYSADYLTSALTHARALAGQRRWHRLPALTCRIATDYSRLFTTWASASISVTQVCGNRRRLNCSANSPAVWRVRSSARCP